MVKTLLIGQGAREHALALKLSQSKFLSELSIWPSNPAMEGLGNLWTHLPKDLGSPATEASFRFLVDAIVRSHIELIVVGPEGPLSMGLADELVARGLHVFGPCREAAQLETDKAYAKKIMIEAGIPTASFCEAHGEEQTRELAYQMLAKKGGVVVKASGLAAGKGVFVCRDHASIDHAMNLLFHTDMKQAASTVVLEEILEGRECSFFVFLGHQTPCEIGFAVDYKRLLNQDQGPNTGGMGCYTPVPWLPHNASHIVMERVVHPLLNTLARRGISYRGCLYVGLMWSPEKGPQVVEFNVRLGDPEAQALSFHDTRDWLPMIAAAAGLAPFCHKSLKELEALSHGIQNHDRADDLFHHHNQTSPQSVRPNSTVGVVLTTASYPYGKDRGQPGNLPLTLFSAPKEC